MKSIPFRTFSIKGQDERGQSSEVSMTTADLVNQALMFIVPGSGGLSVTDVLMLSDIRGRIKSGADELVLEDAQMEHLQRKVEACRWTIWPKELAEFIRDVRKPSTPESTAAA